MSQDRVLDLVELSHHNFTKFSKLPIELRLKIWKLALPGPRVLKMRFLLGAHVQHSKGRSVSRRRLLFPSNSLEGLEMLHVCQEARAVVLDNFDLLSSRDESVKPNKGMNIEHPLYFDCSADMLYFKALRDLGFFTHRNFNSHVKVEGVQRIAVAVDIHDEVCFQSRRGIEEKASQLYQFATAFTHLKECVIVELRSTASSPLLNFMQILDRFVEKEKRKSQIRATVHAEKVGPGGTARLKVINFTKMTEVHFQRVGEVVRKY